MRIMYKDIDETLAILEACQIEYLKDTQEIIIGHVNNEYEDIIFRDVSEREYNSYVADLYAYGKLDLTEKQSYYDITNDLPY